MRIFITGCSGFVGSHACERLVAAGHEVMAMARSDRSAEAVRAFGAAPVRCSLLDVGAEHLMGCDAVVHCAAFVEEWGTREQFWSINVAGTERMLAAAREAGVRRFIHIGTEAAIFDGGDLIDVDESHPYPARHRFLYSETKAEAEERVLAANDTELETISLRPRLVWGPRDTSVMPAVKRMAEAGDFAWIDGGRQKTSTVHVHNVARAIELALTNGTPGHSYFVADDGVRTMRDFLSALLATQNVELGDRSMPGFVVRSAANVAEFVWRMLGRESPPPVTRFAAYMMSATVTVDTTRARDELGYEPIVSVDEGLAELRQG